MATPGRVSPVSVDTPPAELTTITRKRRSRDKHNSNKKKGKSELPVGDGATVFFNCEEDSWLMWDRFTVKHVPLYVLHTIVRPTDAEELHEWVIR